jgi:hypothetical protein
VELVPFVFRLAPKTELLGKTAVVDFVASPERQAKFGSGLAQFSSHFLHVNSTARKKLFK